MAKKKSLERVLNETAPIGETLNHLPPLPITQIRLTDRFAVVSHQLYLFVFVGDKNCVKQQAYLKRVN